MDEKNKCTMYIPNNEKVVLEFIDKKIIKFLEKIKRDYNTLENVELILVRNRYDDFERIGNVDYLVAYRFPICKLKEEMLHIEENLVRIKIDKALFLEKIYWNIDAEELDFIEHSDYIVLKSKTKNIINCRDCLESVTTNCVLDTEIKYELEQYNESWVDEDELEELYDSLLD